MYFVIYIHMQFVIYIVKTIRTSVGSSSRSWPSSDASADGLFEICTTHAPTTRQLHILRYCNRLHDVRTHNVSADHIAVLQQAPFTPPDWNQGSQRALLTETKVESGDVSKQK